MRPQRREEKQNKLIEQFVGQEKLQKRHYNLPAMLAWQNRSKNSSLLWCCCFLQNTLSSLEYSPSQIYVIICICFWPRTNQEEDAILNCDMFMTSSSFGIWVFRVGGGQYWELKNFVKFELELSIIFIVTHFGRTRFIGPF